MKRRGTRALWARHASILHIRVAITLLMSDKLQFVVTRRQAKACRTFTLLSVELNPVPEATVQWWLLAEGHPCGQRFVLKLLL
jgi:hypothetical protein